jgi:hypothetical protein
MNAGFQRRRAVLGTDPATDIVALACAHADEIMAPGERTWLDNHGIDRGFGCY